MLRLSKSVLSDSDKRAVLDVLDRGYLGMGQEVGFFERELAEFIGVDEASVICVSSGTAALHLALMAIGLQEGDEVLVPSITYVASYQAISGTGATPVSCDVDPKTILIDLNDAEKKITQKTKAIMPVHYASNTLGRSDYFHFAEKYDLRVIEDAAHSFGCIDENGRVGCQGDIICFSFDGIKNITSGEGGAIVTDDRDVQSFVRDARLLGVQNDSEKRVAGNRSWKFDVTHQGYRYHMSDIMAGLGRSQLKQVESFFQIKKEIFKTYQEVFSGDPEIKMLDLPKAGLLPHIFVIRVPAEYRDGLKQYVESHDVQTGIHYQPNHLLSFYMDDQFACPESERISEELLSLPMHADLSKKDVEFISNLVIEYLRNART